ncbi:hypothetical protein C8Q74DRAFT_1452025 [Fomes fomentarius]|nr:hypothetical protein C8Q74DRAFT_1452025 [Fomes fomentarius]
MTSTINNNDPSVRYSHHGWEKQQKFGGIHAPTNNVITTDLTLEFDGTGVAVLGFLNDVNSFNVPDLLRCAVDTPGILPPTPLSNAQTSTQLTFCAISSLHSAHHTLYVRAGGGANTNVLISGFVVFSDNTSTGAVINTTLSTQQPVSPSTATTDTSSPPPSPPSQATSSEAGQTSMMTSSPSASSPMPMRTSALNTPSQTSTSHSATNTSSSYDTPSQSPHHPNTAAISGGIVGGIVLLLLILVVVFYSRRWLRATGRRIISSHLTSQVERGVGELEQERGREPGKERDNMSTIKAPALKAWSPELFAIQPPSHSLSPNALDYAFTNPLSVSTSVRPDFQSQDDSSYSRRASTTPLLSSTARGDSQTSTGTAASTDEHLHYAQLSAPAEDPSMRSVQSRRLWYAV